MSSGVTAGASKELRLGEVVVEYGLLDQLPEDNLVHDRMQLIGFNIDFYGMDLIEYIFDD